MQHDDDLCIRSNWEKRYIWIDLDELPFFLLLLIKSLRCRVYQSTDLGGQMQAVGWQLLEVISGSW